MQNLCVYIILQKLCMYAFNVFCHECGIQQINITLHNRYRTVVNSTLKWKAFLEILQWQ